MKRCKLIATQLKATNCGLRYDQGYQFTVEEKYNQDGKLYYRITDPGFNCSFDWAPSVFFENFQIIDDEKELKDEPMPI